MIYPFKTLEELEGMIQDTRDAIGPNLLFRDLMILDNIQKMDDVIAIVKTLHRIIRKYSLKGVTPESVIYPCQTTGFFRHMINLKVAR